MMKIKDTEFELRPADPDKDLGWAYDVFKQTSKGFVEALVGGEWPEAWQHEFFCKGFCHPDTQVIMHDGVPIGFFGIVEDAQKVVVQRLFISPEWQGAGIGGWVLDEALRRAHETRKPFELEVLTNNLPAIDMYRHKGFTVVGADDYGWVKQHVMRHRDTEQYCSRNNPSPEIQNYPINTGDVMTTHPTINPAEITDWETAPRYRKKGVVYAREVTESEIGTELVKPRGDMETLQCGDRIIFDKPNGTPLYPMRAEDFTRDHDPIPGKPGEYRSSEIVSAHFVEQACHIPSPFAPADQDKGFLGLFHLSGSARMEICTREEAV
ncbi:MAG: GNAT family N-acetyltransferase [Rickettsiales bacterium]